MPFVTSPPEMNRRSSCPLVPALLRSTGNPANRVTGQTTGACNGDSGACKLYTAADDAGSGICLLPGFNASRHVLPQVARCSTSRKPTRVVFCWALCPMEMPTAAPRALSREIQVCCQPLACSQASTATHAQAAPGQHMQITSSPCALPCAQMCTPASLSCARGLMKWCRA